MKGCTFCAIIKGEKPCHQIWEDDRFIVILDTTPGNPGHCMVIPKVHIENVFDLPPDLYSDLFQVGRQLEPVIRRATTAPKIGFAVAGFGVPHAHLHIVPLFHGDDLDPHRAKPASDEELSMMAEKIRMAINEKS